MNALYVLAAFVVLFGFVVCLTGFIESREDRREWASVLEFDRARAASRGARVYDLSSRRGLASAAATGGGIGTATSHGQSGRAKSFGLTGSSASKSTARRSPRASVQSLRTTSPNYGGGVVRLPGSHKF